MDRIEVEYQVRATPETIEELAQSIAWEQSVEAPRHLVTDPDRRRRTVGEVVRVTAEDAAPDAYRVGIAYNSELASRQLPQLLNLLFGNVSMYGGVRLTDVRLPTSFLADFQGPRYGIDGLRALSGVYDRPLLATAIKPRGLSPGELARLAGDFALNGGDLVKDDQNIVNSAFKDFANRVTACRDAVAEANAKTGRNCLYFPYLCSPLGKLERHLELLRALDIHGVLVAPLVLGLDTMRWVSREWGLAVMAHPALSGSYTNSGDQGISHEVLFGTLFRLAGADVSIYPGHGGRISYPPEVSQRVADQLRRPMGKLAPAFPCPAGGQQLEDIPGMIRDAGDDSVLLVGGALIGASGGAGQGTRDFVAAIRECCREHLVEPRRPDPPDLHPELEQRRGEILRFASDFTWSGRESTAYKLDADMDFDRARRIPLVGHAGEPCRFELRYFELAPGGYTSLEKHVHIHAIVAVRGNGILRQDEQNQPLSPLDIAVVAPLQVHQLRNEGKEPFGFLCIVDRDRDRPLPA